MRASFAACKNECPKHKDCARFELGKMYIQGVVFLTNNYYDLDTNKCEYFIKSKNVRYY